ncbi:TRAP transporter small permease [Sporosarcina sp. CAU 1771]
MDKFVGYMNFTMKHFLNVIMAVLSLAVFAQVIFRFVLELPLSWSEELAVYCLVWITFLGAAYALSLKAHIGVDFFVDRFPASLKKVFLVIAAIASFSFYIILIIQGYDLVQSSMSQTSPVMKIPMGLIYLVIPLSGLFLIINLIHLLVKDLRTEAIEE